MKVVLQDACLREHPSLSRKTKAPTGIDLDSSGLKAIFLNCTLKPSPALSHTEGLIRIARMTMEKHGVQTELVRPVDFDLAPGVYPDITEHGGAHDEWPALLE